MINPTNPASTSAGMVVRARANAATVSVSRIRMAISPGSTAPGITGARPFSAPGMIAKAITVRATSSAPTPNRCDPTDVLCALRPTEVPRRISANQMRSKIFGPLGTGGSSPSHLITQLRRKCSRSPRLIAMAESPNAMLSPCHRLKSEPTMVKPTSTVVRSMIPLSRPGAIPSTNPATAGMTAGARNSQDGS